MKYCVFKTILGNLKLGYKDLVVYSLLKTDETITECDDFCEQVICEIQEYLNQKRKSFTFKYELSGTEFQKSVYKELIKIPYGQTTSYKQIANNINKSNASRAVGNANNKNKLLIIVPCHRVIGSNNKLIGYALGLETKTTLLKLESSCIR